MFSSRQEIPFKCLKYVFLIYAFWKWMRPSCLHSDLLCFMSCLTLMPVARPKDLLSLLINQTVLSTSLPACVDLCDLHGMDNYNIKCCRVIAIIWPFSYPKLCTRGLRGYVRGTASVQEKGRPSWRNASTHQQSTLGPCLGAFNVHVIYQKRTFWSWPCEIPL